MAKREMPVLDRDKLTTRYLDGESMEALAKGLGVSPGWLARQFQGWNVPLRGRSEALRMRGQAGTQPRL